MRLTLHLIIIGAVMMTVACTDSTRNQARNGTPHVPQPSDTLYTRQAAMSIYGYQPLRALQIIDSAVIVGNIAPWQADIFRMRIYSSSQMHKELDTFLGGRAGARLDKARAVGERLLRHDSIKADGKRQLDVVEMLAYTARMQDDTTRWMERSCQFVAICRRLGPSQNTNALRMEAEIGAALYAMGQQKRGMAKLDSAIYQLDASFNRDYDRGTFDELDALIIALKRKIAQLGSHNMYKETVPLARLIIQRLDDYERHPDDYHDGSYREPKDSVRRADYISFYRLQAQNFISAAYTSNAEHGNMLEAFEHDHGGRFL